MPTVVEIKHRLKDVFEEAQARVLADVIVSAYDELVKAGDFNELKEDFNEFKEDFNELKEDFNELKEDFNELKEIVKDLARSQNQTELRVEELAKEQKELVREQRELAKGQRKLARAQREAQEEIKALAIAMNCTRRDLGGITSTLGFMLENEAYRVLPQILEDRYGIEVKEKFLRRSIRSFGVKEEGEINIFSRGMHKDKGEVVIIGEAKSQVGKDDIDKLLDTAAKLEEIDKGEKFLLTVTHYARETVIEYARKNGVEVIQSFEW